MFKKVAVLSILLACLMSLSWVAVSNAQVLTRQPATTQGLGELVQNDDFLSGREALDQAWAAVENKDTLLALEHFAVAERQFSKVLHSDADNVTVLLYRGTAYIGLGLNERALMDFDRVVYLRPDYVPGYEGKALTYDIMGNVEKAQEMRRAIDAIYAALASKAQTPAPDLYGTWYARNTRHNYTNRFTGTRTINANGFGCGVTEPWKTNVENAVYFSLPWNTWNRYATGFKCTGLCNWVNLNGNLQGYNNAPPFQGWTTPAGENYVLLIAETEVCLAFWVPLPQYFKISADYN